MSEEKQRQLDEINRPRNEELFNNLEKQYQEISKVKSESEQIEERNELADLLKDIGYDWDSYICECQENEEQPQLSYEDFHADAILEAGYRKQRAGEWKLHKDGSGTCSECHFIQKAIWDYDHYQHFCGHCGAKMKGGGE